MENRSRAAALRFSVQTGARGEPYLRWAGGLVALLLIVGAVFLVANPGNDGLPASVRSVAAADQSIDQSSALASRTSCLDIESSDLRLPAEGLWFQSNCLPAAEPFVMPPTTTTCNRTTLNPAEFTEVSPGLYVFRQVRTSTAYLWYSTSEACFDLVSSRVVTAVCADHAVSFSWDASACAAHGGILAWVNGR